MNPPIGLLTRAWIDNYNLKTDTLYIKLNNSTITSANPAIPIRGPHSMFYNNGLYIGTVPSIGTPIIVCQGSGSEYFFVSFLAENTDQLPARNENELLISANPNVKITLNKESDDILIGSDGNRIHIDTNNNYISTNFKNQFEFTQATRYVNGVVRRDLNRNSKLDQRAKLTGDSYFEEFKVVPFDPFTTDSPVTSGSTKNPPFVESREMVYEFQYDSNVVDDLNESRLYDNSGIKNKSNFTLVNRRVSRSDTLSLTLASPNYLIETIKGTVVDIFGNILDLNRYPLPLGQDQNTINASKSTDKVKSFLKIKELQRKSLAYHFEINARKDLTGHNGQVTLPDITSNEDYARNRSRFFIDIDKEGQFKLNVPASSEKGNIPLLTRYENYSTFGDDDNKNPNKFIRRTDNLDIFLDSFASGKASPGDHGYDYSKARGSIQIKDGDAEGAPSDRITKSPIKHGTVYHDILNTCFIHQHSSQYLDYQIGEAIPLTVNLTDIPDLKNIVSTTINVSGDNANAGGRSGSLNFDGSVELNVGANTIDRQSMWVDMAGGFVGNIGRDLELNSAVVGMDGNFFLQVGGFGIDTDSRFGNFKVSASRPVPPSGMMSGILDIRVSTAGGFSHIFRVDANGVTIMTPGDMKLHSGGNMLITADADIRIECNSLTMQERMHLKTFGGSS